MRQIKRNKGSSTLEILIAFTVLILCISAVISVIFGNQSVTVDSQTNNEALYRAQKVLEEARARSRSDFALVTPFSATEKIGPINYSKLLEVRQIDYWTIQATSTITWNTNGKNQGISLSTLFTNPYTSGGGTCSAILSGDWKNPSVTSYEFGKDLLGDPSSGFPITAIDVYKNRLYVSVNNSNGNNFPDFFVFDISDPLIPSLITSMDNDITTKLGLNAIVATDKYAFVANSKQSDFSSCSSPSCGQLQVIDLTVTPPSPVKTFKIPGVTGKNGQAIGTSMALKNSMLYFGLAKTQSGPEFNVIDVSNPINPVYKGGYSVGNAVNAIYVRGNYAYIATPNAENMTIIDVSNPANPFRAGGFTPPGGNNGESVTVIGGKTYLGRTFGSNEFYILNTANPGFVSVIAAKDTGGGNDTSINSIFVRDYLAFFITNAQFQVWNIADPSNIYPWTPSQVTTEFKDLPGGKGTAMDCQGNYIYVGSLPANDKGFISIITAN